MPKPEELQKIPLIGQKGQEAIRVKKEVHLLPYLFLCHSLKRINK